MDQQNEADIKHYCKKFDFNATPFNGDMREFWIWLSWILTMIPSYLLERGETKKRQNPVSEHLDMKIHFGDVLSQDESKSKTQHFKALDDLDSIAKTNILVIYSSVTPTIHAQCPHLWKSHGTDDSSDKILRNIIHIIKRENGGSEEDQNELHLRIKQNIFSFANKPPTTDTQIDKIFNQVIHLEHELHHVGNFRHARHRYELTPFETRTFCTTLLNHPNYSFLRQQIHTVPKPNTFLDVAKMWKADAKNIRGYLNHSSSSSSSSSTSVAIFTAKQLSSADQTSSTSSPSSSTEDTDHIDNPLVQAYRVQNPELSNPQQRNSAFLLAKIKFMEAQLQIHQQHIQTLESQLDVRQQQQQPFQQQQQPFQQRQLFQQRQRQLPSSFPMTSTFQQPFRQQQHPFQQQQQRQSQQYPQRQQQPPRQFQQHQQQQQQPWMSPGKRTFAVSMDEASEMAYERKLDQRARLHPDEWSEEDFDDC